MSSILRGSSLAALADTSTADLDAAIDVYTALGNAEDENREAVLRYKEAEILREVRLEECRLAAMKLRHAKSAVALSVEREFAVGRRAVDLAEAADRQCTRAEALRNLHQMMATCRRMAAALGPSGQRFTHFNVADIVAGHRRSRTDEPQETVPPSGATVIYDTRHLPSALPVDSAQIDVAAVPEAQIPSSLTVGGDSAEIIVPLTQVSQSPVDSDDEIPFSVRFAQTRAVRAAKAKRPPPRVLTQTWHSGVPDADSTDDDGAEQSTPELAEMPLGASIVNTPDIESGTYPRRMTSEPVLPSLPAPSSDDESTSDETCSDEDEETEEAAEHDGVSESPTAPSMAGPDVEVKPRETLHVSSTPMLNAFGRPVSAAVEISDDDSEPGAPRVPIRSDAFSAKQRLVARKEAMLHAILPQTVSDAKRAEDAAVRATMHKLVAARQSVRAAATGLSPRSRHIAESMKY
jgi:hypothetical protein